jgi:hypothetical protein
MKTNTILGKPIKKKMMDKINVNIWNAVFNNLSNKISYKTTCKPIWENLREPINNIMIINITL